MTNAEFELYKKDLRLEKSAELRKDKVAEEYWSEISYRFYNFKRKEMKFEFLNSTHLVMTDLLTFFKVI